MENLIIKAVESKEPMKRNFTLKLIPFIYHETTAEENAVLIDQILSSAESEVAFQEMLEAKEILETAKMRPSRRSIERILAFSRETCDSL